MTFRGAFTEFAGLVTLPTLVRRQRRLEKQLTPLEPLQLQEKAVRGEIDALLVGAGIGKSEAVRVLGYDVVHNERKGQTSINHDKLVALLGAAGVTRDVALWAIRTSSETAAPAKFATVKPAKGAQVRAA